MKGEQRDEKHVAERGEDRRSWSTTKRDVENVAEAKRRRARGGAGVGGEGVRVTAVFGRAWPPLLLLLFLTVLGGKPCHGGIIAFKG